VTVKSAAFVPLIITFGVATESQRRCPCVLDREGVRDRAARYWGTPKSVSSVALGVVSPSAIETLFPFRLISARCRYLESRSHKGFRRCRHWRC